MQIPDGGRLDSLRARVLRAGRRSHIDAGCERKASELRLELGSELLLESLHLELLLSLRKTELFLHGHLAEREAARRVLRELHRTRRLGLDVQQGLLGAAREPLPR